MQPMSPEEFAAFVGLDGADAKHDVCIQAAGTARREFGGFAHSPEAIAAWVQPLRTRFNGQPLAVCLARKPGPMVSAPRQYDFLGLFPGNPLTLAQYRAAFPPSHAQGDPTDAALQGERLLKHRDQLPPLTPQRPPRRALAQLVESRRRLVGDKVRLTHRLTSALKNYFPQVLPWFDDKDTHLLCACLSRWPTLKVAPCARRSSLEPFFRAHHVRQADLIAIRLQAIKQATALTTDDGIVTPHALLVQALVAQLRGTLRVIADFDTAIAPHAQSHP